MALRARHASGCSCTRSTLTTFDLGDARTRMVDLHKCVPDQTETRHFKHGEASAPWGMDSDTKWSLEDTCRFKAAGAYPRQRFAQVVLHYM